MGAKTKRQHTQVLDLLVAEDGFEPPTHGL
jgi:hypothetical protein